MTNENPDEVTPNQAIEASRESLGITSMLNFMEEFPKMWQLLELGQPPSQRQIAVWWDLHRDNPVRIVQALLKLSYKSGKTLTADHAIRMLSSIANNLKTIEQEKSNEKK